MWWQQDLEDPLPVILISNAEFQKHIYPSQVLEDIISTILHEDKSAKNTQAPILAEIINAQIENTFFQQDAKEILQRQKPLRLDREGIVQRRA